MKFRQLVPALTLTLALASQPVLAQGHRGGGSRGGHGGSHGGSRGSAVARQPSGRPGHPPRTVAQQRHPRPGTGSGYYGGRSYGYGGYGHGGYGYRGHGYYRPYYGYRPYYSYPYYSYPYYSYPYYSSYWPGLSLSFGWGSGSSVSAYYGGPGYSMGVSAHGTGGGEDSGAPPPEARDTERSYEGPSGRVRLEVRPEDASVYVDNEFRGTARDARILNLPPGRHVIELVRPGFTVERREVEVVSGERQDVFVELLRP